MFDVSPLLFRTVRILIQPVSRRIEIATHTKDHRQSIVYGP